MPDIYYLCSIMYAKNININLLVENLLVDVDEITPRGRFNKHIYKQHFLAKIPEVQKRELDCIFCTFGICVHKSCSKNVD